MQGRGRFIGWGTCALAGLASLLLATPASAADPGWLAPLDLSPAYLYANPQIAPDEGGGFVASWSVKREEDSLTEVHTARIPHSGTGVADQSLGGLTFFGSSLASSGNGRAILAWDDHSDLCCVGLAAALKQPGAGFASPIAIPYGDPDESSVGIVRAAMNGGGRSVIAYTLHHSDNTEEIWAVFGTAAGSFGPPLQVSESIDSNFQSIDVALANDGEAFIGWADPPVGIRMAVGTGSGFGSPQTVSAPDPNLYAPAIAADDSGGAVAAWTVPTAPDYVTGPVSTAVRPPGGTFGESVEVASDGGGIDAGASAAGDALVSYRDRDAQVKVTPIDLETGAIGTGRTIGLSYQPQIAIAPNGRAVASFGGSAAAWGDASGAFGPPHTVACGLSGYDTVIDPSGNAAMLLSSLGADTGDDVDDRALIARSDPAIAVDDQSCLQKNPPPIAPPPGPDRPRLALETPRKVKVNDRGVFKVTAKANVAGEIRLRGNALVGPTRSHLRGSKASLDAAGSVRMRLKLKRPALRRLDSGSSHARANIEGHLDAEARDVTKHFRVHLRG